VTKFKFEFENIRTSECEFVEKSLFHDWFHMVCTDSQTAQTNFFLNFNLSHKLQLLNVQHNFCSVMCHVVLMWTLILLTLENNIVTLLFNWLKPVHYVSTDTSSCTGDTIIIVQLPVLCVTVELSLQLPVR